MTKVIVSKNYVFLQISYNSHMVPMNSQIDNQRLSQKWLRF